MTNGNRRWSYPPQALPALHDLRVLDFSTYTPGPFCTQILADLGATVLKVERPPTGDAQRRTVPEYFHAMNRGKASITMDLKSLVDTNAALELASHSDVVVESFRPGVMDRLGLGQSSVSKANPALVYVSLSPYATTGPSSHERGHDRQFMARAGAFIDPVGTVYPTPPVPISDLAAGMYAVVGILASLGQADRDGVHLGVPIMGSALAWMFMRLIREVDSEGLKRSIRVEPGSGTFRTSDDRYISISAIEQETWGQLVELLEVRSLRSPFYAEYMNRARYADTINRVIGERMAERTRQEWISSFAERDIPAAPANSAPDVFDDPVVRALDVLQLYPTPSAALPLTGLPSIRNVKPPQLDEHGEAVRARGWRALEGWSRVDRSNKFQ